MQPKILTHNLREYEDAIGIVIDDELEMYGVWNYDARYSQCKLQKGDSITYAWIPHQMAVLNKVLSLKNDNGWKVIKVGHTLSEIRLKKQQSQMCDTRDISDIDIRKIEKTGRVFG